MKICREHCSLLISDKDNGYFARRPICIYDTSLNSSQNEKYFRQNFVDFTFNNVFTKIVPFVVKCGKI